MFRLLLLGVLWIMAIAVVTFAVTRYFNSSQYLSHKEKMYELKNDDD